MALKCWWQYCRGNSRDIYEPSVASLLNFFTSEFNLGKSYGTLNNSRAAISLITDPELSNDHRIKRFFKGIHNLKPNKPRYDVTWDPNVVLTYWENKEDNNTLSIKDLTLKLVTLVALVTAHRAQTLSLIKVNNIVRVREGLEIKIEDRIKTSGVNRTQPVLRLPRFTERPSLCVASCIETYLEKTKAIRGNEQQLFLTIKNPVRAATTQTICRWIKWSLEQSGLDTNVFKAHSTRHASTSAVSRKGICLDVIRNTAGWTSTECFSKFYNRPIVRDTYEYGKALLKL